MKAAVQPCDSEPIKTRLPEGYHAVSSIVISIGASREQMELCGNPRACVTYFQGHDLFYYFTGKWTLDSAEVRQSHEWRYRFPVCSASERGKLRTRQLIR